MELVMVELLASDSQNNVKNEYQSLCEEPKSNSKLVHYLYKGNAITDDDYENVFVNSGHFRYGLTMAPQSAENLNEILLKSI